MEEVRCLRRLMAKVDRSAGETECWNWTASTTAGRGCGQFRIGGKVMRAHRVMYQCFVGPVPDGMDVNRTCGNRRCMNYRHMEPVSRRETVLRAGVPEATHRRYAAQTHCKRGHEYTEANTYWRVIKGVWCRSCNTCRGIRNRGGAPEAEHDTVGVG